MNDNTVEQLVFVSNGNVDQNKTTKFVAVFDSAGAPVSLATSEASSVTALTGLAAGPATAVTSTDTLLEAIANLQAQIDDHEGRIVTLEGA